MHSRLNYDVARNLVANNLDYGVGARGRKVLFVAGMFGVLIGLEYKCKWPSSCSNSILDLLLMRYGSNPMIMSCMLYELVSHMTWARHLYLPSACAKHQKGMRFREVCHKQISFKHPILP